MIFTSSRLKRFGLVLIAILILLSMRLSPFSPYLPRYPGPHQVGTIEVELPLPKDLQRSFGENTVKTLLVRLFYPTTLKHGRRPKWTGPGNYTIRGYAQFLGLKEGLLSAASYLGLKWTEIPALTDAPLAASTSSSAQKWPCMVFSHGLGGTRNAYSQVSGSIASGGVVVMAIEHRDSSAAISVVHPDGDKGVEEVVEYVSIRDSTPANIKKRRHQMAQRAYEVRLGLELFRSLESGSNTTFSTLPAVHALESFKSKLNVAHGQFLMAGHSFGAATAVNSCKDTTTHLPSVDSSTYTIKSEFKALVLLDVWTEVLVDSDAVPLSIPTLSIASQAFQKWNGNWRSVEALMRRNVRWQESKSTWIKGSAHLSQSDFGILFPLATKYAFKAEINPLRAMDLNVRAVREFLRQVGVGEEGVDEDIFSGKEEELIVEKIDS